jgi:hypothetical protein
VAGAKRKGKGRGCWAGGCEAGPTGPVLHARERRKASRPGSRGLGWKGREREGGSEEFVFFFQISFKFIFQTFKLKSNKNPCIQIMMHKHLCFLNYFSDVYLFKSQFV